MSLPEKRLTNFDLEKMLATSDEWIVQRTGIRERRIAPPGTATSDLAAASAAAALKEAGVKPEELDLVIVATFSPDCPFPATACAVQAKLGAVNAAAFDVGAACAGFVYGLSVAEQYIRTGAAETVLLVGAEVLSTVLDYEDRNTCILFGDGAGSAILRAGDAGGHEVVATRLGTDGTRFELLWIPAGGSRYPATEETVRERRHFIRMDGRAVFKVAVQRFRDAIAGAARAAGWSLDEVDAIIPHQVNKRIVTAVAGRLSVPESKFFQNIDRYGNTSAASIPIAMREAELEGRLRPGDRVILPAVGGGITWGAAAVRW